LESDVILKPPPPDASTIGVLWHQAKELFKFYYGGIKMQWTHHKMVQDINARVKAERAQGIERGMTRWETQFVRTHEKDLIK
jgi:LETM1 and EF-hand domain-containing protein 1